MIEGEERRGRDREGEGRGGRERGERGRRKGDIIKRDIPEGMPSTAVVQLPHSYHL